jgi:CHAT domain-containing protein/Tfp pilus assembly protein PilF
LRATRYRAAVREKENLERQGRDDLMTEHSQTSMANGDIGQIFGTSEKLAMEQHTCFAVNARGFLRAGLCLMFAASTLSSAALLQDESAAQSVPAQNVQETTLLELGKPVEQEIAAKQKRSFHFQLGEKQYATFLLNCHRMTADATLLDTAGAAMKLYDLDSSDDELTMDMVAEQGGNFGLDVVNKLPDAPTGKCSVQLATLRAATDKELLIHQSNVLSYKVDLLIAAEKLEEAFETAQRALALREKAVGPDDSYVALSLNTLGQISFLRGDYPKAASFILRALNIQEKRFGPDSPKVFRFAANLGAIYMTMDDFDKAAEFMQRAAKIREKAAGPNDALLASVFHNLGNVYIDKADYAKAQEFIERALAIEEKLLGPVAADVGDTVNNLGVVYVARGDFLRAGELYQRALTIYEKTLPPDDSRLGYPLMGLANVHYQSGDLAKAELFCRRALAISEKALGDEHPEVAGSLDTLAEIYHDQHEFAKAEPLYQRSLDIRKKKLGENHSAVAGSLSNIGTLYFHQGDYARAESLYQQALAIREKTLGPEHPNVAASLDHYSTLYMAKGDFTQSEAFLSRAIAISERNADLNLQLGSERQKLAYLELLADQLYAAITLNVEFAPAQSAARDLAVTTVLQRKGRVQDALAGSLEALRRRMNPEDAELLDRFNNITARLSRLVLGGPPKTLAEQYQQQISALKEEREQLESEISRRSAQFRATSQPVTLDAVRAALPPQSALLEFAAYKRFLPAGVTEKERFGETRYVVYVVRGTGEVTWKELGEAKPLDDLILKFRQALRDPHRTDIKNLARAADEKIMQPLLPSIGDATRLLVSPDGDLNLVPFEALMDEQGHYLAERYSITYLTTGRDLLRMQISRENKSAPLVIADPFFGEPGVPVAGGVNQPKLRNVTLSAQRRSITTGEDLSSVYFAPLGGTAREARSIQSLFPDSQVLTGKDASKAALKRIEAPRILHIATHGFFLQDAASEAAPAPKNAEASGTRSISASAKIENPLLRSGLALSGANLNKEGGDDGILTALEASNLNLWGTKLVTLSACDTGVGEVKNGEGVYGLRRAFFLAGADSLVMSLWPVSDSVTRELMTGYYSRLKAGLGRGEALRQAQLAMLKRKDHQHPFYWASFIQAGDWANLDGQR